MTKLTSGPNDNGGEDLQPNQDMETGTKRYYGTRSLKQSIKITVFKRMNRYIFLRDVSAVTHGEQDYDAACLWFRWMKCQQPLSHDEFQQRGQELRNILLVNRLLLKMRHGS